MRLLHLLFLCHFVVRVRLESGIRNLLDINMLLEESRQDRGVFALLANADDERLHASLSKIAVER